MVHIEQFYWTFGGKLTAHASNDTNSQNIRNSGEKNRMNLVVSGTQKKLWKSWGMDAMANYTLINSGNVRNFVDNQQTALN